MFSSAVDIDAVKRITGAIAYSCGAGCGRKGDGTYMHHCHHRALLPDLHVTSIGGCWLPGSMACSCNQRSNATTTATAAIASGTKSDTATWTAMVWLDTQERNPPVIDDY